MSRIYDERTSPTFVAPRTGAAGSFLGAINRFLVQPLLAVHRARIAYRELMALDDRQLADIGLHRNEIAAALTGRRSELGETGGKPVNFNQPSRRAA